MQEVLVSAPAVVPARIVAGTGAVAGYTSFGAVSAFALQEPSLTWALLFASAVTLLAPMPTLIVAQQWLRLSAPPTAVWAAVEDAWCRAGLLALALTPILGFFATAECFGLLFILFVLGLGGVGLARAASQLTGLEPAAGRGTLLVFGWVALAVGIGGTTFLIACGE